jgi:hypothetical protein
VVIKPKFRFPEIFFGMLLAVAIFAMGAMFVLPRNASITQQTPVQQSGDKKPNSQGSKSLWIPEDATGFFTLWVAAFTGLLALCTFRLFGATRDVALASQKQAIISSTVEGPMPLISAMKLVQYQQIPGEIAVTDPVPPGPIPTNCRILPLIENKGRTPLRPLELCVEKFAGSTLPARPSYTQIEPFGLVLEKGPLWIRLADTQAYLNPTDVASANAAYPNGAFWVFGYLAHLSLLNERVEYKFLWRWDLVNGFVPDNRLGYT